MTTYVCGNSHIGALARGATQMSISEQDICFFALGSGIHEIEAFFSLKNKTIQFTVESYRGNVARVTGSPFLNPDHTWGFCIGTHNARLYRNSFWREAEPSEICLQGKRPITQATLDACIETDQHYIRNFLSAVKEVGIHPFVVSCPPPRSDHSAISYGIRREVIRYIDNRSRDLFTQFLNQLDIPFINHPEEVKDEDGFLKSKFRALISRSGKKDQHHANVEYGQIMVKTILHYLNKEELLLNTG